MELAERLLSNYKNDINSLTLIPSSGGVFEVKLEDNLIYSKKETGKFPEFEEITKNF